jgi:hypothetical protein
MNKDQGEIKSRPDHPKHTLLDMITKTDGDLYEEFSPRKRMVFHIFRFGTLAIVLGYFGFRLFTMYS